jgi:hypothetical protein
MHNRHSLVAQVGDEQTSSASGCTQTKLEWEKVNGIVHLQNEKEGKKERGKVVSK